MIPVERDIMQETLKSLGAILEIDEKNPDIEYINVGEFRYKFQFCGVFTAIKVCGLFDSGKYDEFAKLAFSFSHRETPETPELTEKYFLNKVNEAMDWLLLLRGLLWRDDPFWRKKNSRN